MLVRDVILLLCKASRFDSRSTGDAMWPGLAGLIHTLSLSLNRLAIAIAWVILIGLLRTALVKHGIQTESSELGATVDDDADGSDAAAGRGVVEEMEEGGED